MHGPRPRALISTHHFQDIAGSEIVALEWATYFHELGREVSLFANWSGNPMAALVSERLGLGISSDPKEISPFTFDLVYAQHHVLPLFRYDPVAGEREVTRIVTGRLSRRSFLESGGWAYERALADATFANSALTAEHLLAAGAQPPVTVFHNAAPAAFFSAARPRPRRPRHITVVSNHADPALLGAIALLRGVAKVEHFGKRATRHTLVTPELLAETDLVISIGKTVQYALAGRIPVFVYDHFGGPGYLDAGNRELAHRFSFTGRCCERRVPADELAREIMEDYGKGSDFAAGCEDLWLQQFRLERYLEAVPRMPARPNEAKRAAMRAEPFLAQERLMAAHARASYIAARQDAKTIRRLKKRLLAAGLPA